MSDIIRAENTLLFLAKEATYASGGAIAATDAMLAESVVLRPLQGNIERIHQKRGFGGSTRGNRTERYMGIEITLALAGSGTADVAPPQGLLYKGSGHGEVITGATSVDYAPISTNEDSLYGGFYADDRYHLIKGLRGGLKFKLGTDGAGMVSFTGIALYTAPSESVPTTPDFSAFQLPQDINASTVTEMTFFGETVGMSELNITGRDTPQYLNVVNLEEVIQQHTGASYSITFREPKISSYDFWAASCDLTPGAMAFQLGTDVTDKGDIFEFDAPNLFIENIEPVEVSGINYLRCSGPIVPTAANNDYSFAHR